MISSQIPVIIFNFNMLTTGGNGSGIITNLNMAPISIIISRNKLMAPNTNLLIAMIIFGRMSAVLFGQIVALASKSLHGNADLRSAA